MFVHQRARVFDVPLYRRLGGEALVEIYIYVYVGEEEKKKQKNSTLSPCCAEAVKRLQTCFERALSEASSAARYLKLRRGRQYAKFVFHVCAFLTACICLACTCAPCLCVRDYCEWVQADSRAPLGDGLIRQGSASKRLTAARASASLPLT